MERYDEDEGVWRTINGQHIFIKDGEDVATAMRRQGMRRTGMSKEQIERLKRHGRSNIARKIDEENEEDIGEYNRRQAEEIRKEKRTPRIMNYNGRAVKIYSGD